MYPKASNQEGSERFAGLLDDIFCKKTLGRDDLLRSKEVIATFKAVGLSKLRFVSPMFLLLNGINIKW